MPRYFDADALLSKMPDDLPYKSSVKRVLMQAPAADVVKVVKCKDCEHATFYSCKNDACYRGIICEYRIGTDDENFFCSYGERKE